MIVSKFLKTKMFRIIRKKFSVLRKTHLYQILTITFVLLSTFYLIDYITNQISDSKYLLRYNLTKNEIYSDEVIDDKYFVKTSGCRIVKLEIMSSNQTQNFIDTDRPKEIDCGIPPLTDSDENFLWINLTETDLKKFYNLTVDQMTCYFSSFSRLTDYSVIKNDTLTLLTYGQRMKIDSEYIEVICNNSNQTEIYKDFHTFFPSSVRNLNADKEKYHVMILGMDSVSKLNFHRMLKKTAKTLIEELDAIEFDGFNKVADNTYPNLIPVLTGLTADELNDSCLSLNPSGHFDNCSIIWDNFKKKNYNTLYGEDAAFLSLFNYLKNGFAKQPTDFYYRNMIYRIEEEIGHNHLSNYKLCSAHQRRIDVFFKGYIKKFVKSMANAPTFSFLWTSSISHDYINFPMLIDEDLSNLFKFMKDTKYLEKTILISFADHGLRYGSYRAKNYQGMIEERLRELNSFISKKPLKAIKF